MFEIEQWRIFYFKGVYGLYSKNVIKRQFSVSKTPQQNGVVERKNETIQEMARTMLMDSKLTDVFWAHAMHTIVHIQQSNAQKQQ